MNQTKLTWLVIGVVVGIYVIPRVRAALNR